MNYGSYTCPVPKPTDCSAITLPTVNFATCPAAYQAHESEICSIWISETTDGVADNKPVNWYDSTDLDGTVGIIKLTVIGDKPLSEISEQAVAKRWTKVTNRRHTINFDITDMSIENYDFVRALQINPTIAVWFETIDGYICGGADGIVCDVQNAGNIFNRGEGGLLTGQSVLFWDADCDPPIAIDGTDPNPGP